MCQPWTPFFLWFLTNSLLWTNYGGGLQKKKYFIVNQVPNLKRVHLSTVAKF